MRRQLLLSLLALGVVLPCSAGDVGIGVTMASSTASIYVPWKVSPHFKLEGEVSYFHQYEVYNYGNGTESPSRTTASVGVGCFWVHPVTDASHLYLGPRIGFAQSKYGSGSQSEHSQTNGIYIAPVVGFEYFPIKSVSLGAEVGVGYSKSHSSVQNNFPSIDHTEQEGTFSSIILRYYF